MLTRKFWLDALDRAIRTFAQAMLASIGVAQGRQDAGLAGRTIDGRKLVQ